MGEGTSRLLSARTGEHTDFWVSEREESIGRETWDEGEKGEGRNTWGIYTFSPVFPPLFLVYKDGHMGLQQHLQVAPSIIGNNGK